MRLKVLSLGEKYIFKKDFYVGDLPSRLEHLEPLVSPHIKKGEIVTYEGRSRGRVQMRGNNRRLILMSRKEALDFLEEAIDTEGVKEFIRQRYAGADVRVGKMQVVRDGVWLGAEGEALLEEKARKHIAWIRKHPKRAEKEGALV